MGLQPFRSGAGRARLLPLQMLVDAAATEDVATPAPPWVEAQCVEAQWVEAHLLNMREVWAYRSEQSWCAPERCHGWRHSGQCSPSCSSRSSAGAS